MDSLTFTITCTRKKPKMYEIGKILQNMARLNDKITFYSLKKSVNYAFLRILDFFFSSYFFITP